MVVIFLSTTGLQFILNSSSYLSGLIGMRDNEDRRNALIQNLVIDDIPEESKSDKITVSGSVNNFETLKFYINDRKVKEIDAPKNGQFSTEIGPLQKGENEIYVIAESKQDEKRSDSFTVVFRSEKPKLEIKEPSDQSTTGRDEVKLVGVTDKEVAIKVNDSPVVVGFEGKFETFVKLKEGENKIKITATDPAGNQEEKELTVKYEK